MLHLTKVAFGVSSAEHLAERVRLRAAEGGPGNQWVLTTRYLPKRHEEVGGKGSLYWIIKHQLVARSPILRFGEADGGRVSIHLGVELVLVQARPKRAHQGWRYLEHGDAPVDLGSSADGVAEMPTGLAGKLAELGLI
jgi:hypothetical protein